MLTYVMFTRLFPDCYSDTWTICSNLTSAALYNVTVDTKLNNTNLTSPVPSATQQAITSKSLS